VIINPPLLSKDRNTISSVNEYMQNLPLEFRKNFIFMGESGSPQEAKDETPKVIMKSDSGKVVISVGCLIMSHSDDDSLVLPPKISSVHVSILPIAPKKGRRKKN